MSRRAFNVGSGEHRCCALHNPMRVAPLIINDMVVLNEADIGIVQELNFRPMCLLLNQADRFAIERLTDIFRLQAGRRIQIRDLSADVHEFVCRFSLKVSTLS